MLRYFFSHSVRKGAMTQWVVFLCATAPLRALREMIFLAVSAKKQ
jgi:hypothetical protein